jgi:uncharacterized membrane protein
MSRSTAFVIAFTLLTVAAAFLLPPMPQPLDYHDFADQRDALGIENFLDVVSNLAFLAAGLAGLYVVFSGRACFEFPAERWPYAVFFLGILLTAAGSAWYHLAPDNETLFWDRLPMTIAFMGLVSSQVADRISVRAGLVLLGPILLVGVASVVYWIFTERQGAGNVLPYALLQGYAVLVLLIMAALHRSRYTRANDLYLIFGWYVLAKLLEFFDAPVLEYSRLVSGHSLKHVAAAVAGFVTCRMLLQRSLAAPERSA